MRTRAAVVRSTIVVLLSVTAAADTRITFRCVGDEPCKVAGTLTFRTPDNAPPRQARVENSVAHLPSTNPPEQVELTLNADGFWMLPEYVTTTASNAPVLKVWRTTRLRGRFELRPPDKELPKQLSVAVETPPGMPGAAIPRGTPFDCTVSPDATWECVLPATTLDVVLRPKTFTPHYAVDVKLRPDAPADMGRIILKRGSSVVAWLDSRTVKSLKEPARGQLVRMTMGPSPTLGDRLSQPVAGGVFNPRGMLQLAPVPAGTYTLEISAPGFAPARIDQVAVYERSESAIRVPIRLEPPLTIRLAFDPPRDPDGAFWQVSVTRADRFTSRRVGVAEATAKNGVLEIGGQPPGHYIVSVEDKDENRFAYRELDIQSDADAQRTIDVALLRMKGIVTLAGKPIEADLAFGGRSGAIRVQSHAGSDGHFEIALPRAGKWTVDVENKERNVLATVTASVTDGKEIEISLPDTELSGRVVGLSGERLAGAEVTLWTTGVGAINQRSNPDGTFSFRGVPPGTVNVDARDLRSGLATRPVRVTVTDGLHRSDIELVLQNSRTVKGSVTSGGQPVIGARILALAITMTSTRMVNAVSGLDGGFEVEIPGDATQVAMIVSAAGRTLEALTTTVGDRPIRVDVAPSGGTLRLRVRGANPVVRHNGTVIPMSELLQWARAQDPSVTIGDYFNVMNMAPGPYRFCSRPKDKEVCDEGLLAPGATLVLGDE